MRISEAKILLTSIFQYNLDQLKAGASYKTFMVPFFEGPPGVGKTAIPTQVAQELEIPLHQTIVAQFDAGEMAGLPFVGEIDVEDDDGKLIKEKRMVRLRPTYMPDPKREDGIVGIWNFDEMPQAPLANLNICSQIFNQWRVGEHEVSPGITICATGNRAEDKAGTTVLPMHLRDRLMYIGIDVDHEESMAYAAEKAWDYRIRAYLQKNPASLHNFVVGAKAFPTPRSWEKSAGVLKMGLPKHIQLEALRGQIGEEAYQFETYIEMEKEMIDPADIIKDPENAPVYGSEKADILYLLITNLAEMANDKNVGQIIKWLRRLPNKEFSVLWVKDATKRHPTLNNNKHMTDFKLKDVTELLQ